MKKKIENRITSRTLTPENCNLCCQTYSASTTLHGHTNRPYSSFIFYFRTGKKKNGIHCLHFES